MARSRDGCLLLNASVNSSIAHAHAHALPMPMGGGGGGGGALVKLVGHLVAL